MSQVSGGFADTGDRRGVPFLDTRPRQPLHAFASSLLTRYSRYDTCVAALTRWHSVSCLGSIRRQAAPEEGTSEVGMAQRELDEFDRLEQAAPGRGSPRADV